ncbi:MAG: HAD family hydrolase [Traorella sp.]
MIKGIIFDFNGTLFEDSDIHVDVWIRFFKEKLGYDMSEEEFFRRIHGRDNNQIIQDMFHLSDLEEIHRLSEEKEALYRAICRSKDISLVKGAESFFEKCQQKKIPFTIATGSNRSNVDFYFEVFHLDKWFDYHHIILDDGYLPGKPNPTIYLKACEMIQIPCEKCLVIEDSLAGVKAAKGAHIKEIYVISHKHPFDEEVSGYFDDFDDLWSQLCLRQLV